MITLFFSIKTEMTIANLVITTVLNWIGEQDTWHCKLKDNDYTNSNSDFTIQQNKEVMSALKAADTSA